MVGQMHVRKLSPFQHPLVADNAYSHLDPARAGISCSQIPHLLSRTAHGCRASQGRQDPQELGIQHRKEDTQDPTCINLGGDREVDCLTAITTFIRGSSRGLLPVNSNAFTTL